MRIFKIILFLFLISIPIYLNHLVYGNSNSTISHIERIETINRSRIKTKNTTILADYMYNRIKFYQKFDTWYERWYAIETNYEALQNMNLDKE